MQAAGGLKKVVLELGGKSPNILLPGADIEAGGRAVGPAVHAQLGAGLRRDDADARAPRRPRPRGTRARRSSMARRRRSVGRAHRSRTADPPRAGPERPGLRRAGHRRRCRGRRRDPWVPRPPAGTTSTPSLFGGVDNDAEICQEELFGPVGVVIPYDTRRRGGGARQRDSLRAQRDRLGPDRSAPCGSPADQVGDGRDQRRRRRAARRAVVGLW